MFDFWMASWFQIVVAIVLPLHYDVKNCEKTYFDTATTMVVECATRRNSNIMATIAVVDCNLKSCMDYSLALGFCYKVHMCCVENKISYISIFIGLVANKIEQTHREGKFAKAGNERDYNKSCLSTP